MPYRSKAPRQIMKHHEFVDAISSAISQRISNLRHMHGLSQHELARLSTVTQPTIHHLEAGRRRDPAISTVSMIAEALGVSIDYLTGREQYRVVVEREDVSSLEPDAGRADVSDAAISKGYTADIHDDRRH